MESHYHLQVSRYTFHDNFSKVYANALGLGTVTYNNTQYDVLVATLAIALKDGTRNTFVYFYETSQTFSGVYYPLNNIFQSAVISSVDMFFDETDNVLLVALGVPDIDSIVVLGCEFPAFSCWYSLQVVAGWMGVN